MSFKIKGETRNVFGKNASRRIRQEGMIPAILYDTDTVSIPLTLNKKDVFAILKAETGENTIFKISFNSETRNTMIKELQRDPVTDEILHADLIQIAMDNIISVSVPIVLVGEAVGVKAEGGFVDFVTREVEIECLPKNIPEQLEIDISSLHLHQSLKVEDLSSPGEITLVTDPNTVVVLIHAPTKEELEVEEIEEEIIAEEEPEVIKKEKPEEEEKEKEEKDEKEKE
ncbi:MAG: 50S ribosomal protein L25 [Candidatus Aminicenantes bacterium]|nr:MAG: 50S ribosomal protein L25 [Candidatus Aminicenantes bacterium]